MEEHYIVARPHSGNSHGLILQLQKLHADGSKQPIYNLVRHGHVLDPLEAIVTTYDDRKAATFVSSSTHTRKRRSTTETCTPNLVEKKGKRLSVERYDPSGSSAMSGTMSVLVSGNRMNWTIANNLRDYSFSCIWHNSEGLVEHTLVWSWQSTRDSLSIPKQSVPVIPKRSFSASSNLPIRSSKLGVKVHLHDTWHCQYEHNHNGRASFGILGIDNLSLVVSELNVPVQAWQRTCVLMSALWILSHVDYDESEQVRSESMATSVKDAHRTKTPDRRVSFAHQPRKPTNLPVHAVSPTRTEQSDSDTVIADGHTTSPNLKTILQFVRACIPRHRARKIQK